MSEQSSSYPGYGSPAVGGGEDASVTDKASASAEAAKQAAADVAQTAATRAKEVAAEAQSQARNLVGEARDQLRGHAGDQHRNAVTNLRSLGDELHAMAQSGRQGGVATDLVSQASGRAHGVADWLNGREPEDLLEELRRLARRRPGAFLLGALATGVAAGRLTRGAVAAHSDDTDASEPHPVPGDDQNPTRAVVDGSSGVAVGGAVGGGVGGYGVDPAGSAYGAGYGSDPGAGLTGTPGAGGLA